jgi:2-amino-4-hydroxy-6-hydroxymethyldihydropteridine diphosphokinase
MEKSLQDSGVLPIISVVAKSPLYRTAPVGGPPGQTDYLNAAIRVTTSLSAQQLLDRCLEVEQRLGRVRRERWGPRTLDLDILLYGDEIVSDEGLTIPHPMLRSRLFVLVPLADIAPVDLLLPPDGSILASVLSAQLATNGLALSDYKSNSIYRAGWGTKSDVEASYLRRSMTPG